MATDNQCLARRGFKPGGKVPLKRYLTQSAMGMPPHGYFETSPFKGEVPKWPEANALPDQKAETIVEVIVKKLIPLYGVPDQID